MTTYVIYEATTGKIHENGFNRNPEIVEVPAGYVMLTGTPPNVNQRTQYVSNDEVVDRPVLNPTVSKTTLDADGIDEVVITGLPSPAHVLIDGEEAGIVTDGELIFTADIPTTYEITVTNIWPFLDWTVKLEAI